MYYLEDISALEYWTSSQRALLDGKTWEPISSLADCPKTAKESTLDPVLAIPCVSRHLNLAVPSQDCRPRHDRVSYHVWTKPIPEKSFWRINDEVAVASPALMLVQVASKLLQIHYAQISCSILGSYLPVQGDRAGMIDGLKPLATLKELIDMCKKVKGIYSSKHVYPTLKYLAENSASPRETDLLLLVSMTKKKGGLNRRGWEMNPELDIPSAAMRRYLGQSTIKPDLLMRDKMVVLEYQSDEWHSTAQAIEEDEKRKVVFEAMGYKVVAVYTSDMKDAFTFERVAELIYTALGEKYTCATDQQLVARQCLINELNNNPWLS